MGLGALLVILLVLAVISVLPTWGYSSSWGYAPGSVIGLVERVSKVPGVIQVDDDLGLSDER